ncbi:TPA: hypothetical protein NIA45_006745 [Pseudomonas aeruginosa]|nr:hypothetical protein [Pseudomonas aeruginosa]
MEEIERLGEIAREQKMARSKGHARIALRNKGPYLEEALANFITLPRIVEDLAENGVLVSVASLRKWLMEFLPDQYAEYLQITGRGRKVNRAGAVGATEEKKEVKAEAPAGAGNRREKAQEPTGEVARGEETPATETKPAATGQGAPIQSAKQLSDKAAAMVEQLRDSDD